MNKRPKKNELCYKALKWSGPANDINLTGEACLRCRKPFTTDAMFVVFYIEGQGELAELCWLCADFWRICFTSLGIKPRYVGPSKLKLVKEAGS